MVVSLGRGVSGGGGLIVVGFVEAGVEGVGAGDDFWEGEAAVGVGGGFVSADGADAGLEGGEVEESASMVALGTGRPLTRRVPLMLAQGRSWRV